MKQKKISVITPSFNQAEWLKLCIESVADQKQVDKEHIIQDSCSDDGTQNLLATDKRIRPYIEKDKGMYDGVNRGIQRSSGEILGYLNCDEQYLPDALKKVVEFFELNPKVDVLFTGTLVVDNTGELICFRKAIKPSKSIILADHLPTFTCSTFFRRKVFSDYKLFFDTRYRDVSDAKWVLQLIEKRISFAVSNFYTSVFTDTGTNMNMSENALKEIREIYVSAPTHVIKLRKLIILLHRLKKLLKGFYNENNLNYSIFTQNSVNKRKSFNINKPKAVWQSRLGIADQNFRKSKLS